MMNTCSPGGRGRVFQIECTMRKDTMVRKSTTFVGDLVKYLRVIRVVSKT